MRFLIPFLAVCLTLFVVLNVAEARGRSSGCSACTAVTPAPAPLPARVGPAPVVVPDVAVPPVVVPACEPAATAGDQIVARKPVRRLLKAAVRLTGKAAKAAIGHERRSERRAARRGC